MNTQETILFVHDHKIKNIEEVLKKANVTIKKYEDIFDYLENFNAGTTIATNLAKANYSILNSISKCEIIELDVDITTELKAIKNEVELANLEKTNVRDGVYMVKIIKEIKERANENITEVDVHHIINKYRKEDPNYLKPSFSTISAYMANGAMLHYRAKKETCATIKAKGFLLVDSGATYLDGTTDITRTIVMGELTNQMKTDFTLVLKSHIALISAVFLYGTTGSNIDILARMPMWENGMDYKSGTGHGIGFCMNVHEGPQRIARVPNGYRFEKGMVTTNEPGVYKTGEYGIRTENTTVVKHKNTTEAGEFLCFEVISYCPIDIEAIDTNMLNEKELNWINDYHELVYNKLSGGLNEEEIQWLKQETKKI